MKPHIIDSKNEINDILEFRSENFIPYAQATTSDGRRKELRLNLVGDFSVVVDGKEVHRGMQVAVAVEHYNELN